MTKKKSFRLLTAVALCVMLVCSFSVTAFAYADDTEQNLPITEATQPEDTPETTPEPDTAPETIVPGEPLEDEVMPTPAICFTTKPQTSSSLR